MRHPAIEALFGMFEDDPKSLERIEAWFERWVIEAHGAGEMSPREYQHNDAKKGFREHMARACAAVAASEVEVEEDNWKRLEYPPENYRREHHFFKSKLAVLRKKPRHE